MNGHAVHRHTDRLPKLGSCLQSVQKILRLHSLPGDRAVKCQTEVWSGMSDGSQTGSSSNRCLSCHPTRQPTACSGFRHTDTSETTFSTRDQPLHTVFGGINAPVFGKHPLMGVLPSCGGTPQGGWVCAGIQEAPAGTSRAKQTSTTLILIYIDTSEAHAHRLGCKTRTYLSVPVSHTLAVQP